MPRLLNWPRSVNAMIVGLGLALILITSGPGWIPEGDTGAVTIRKTGTVTTTRTVERRVHGRIVRREEKVYVRVPLIVVHTDGHTIRVPAHLLPISGAAATIAHPMVTVRVAVPTTVYVPTTVTTTETVTSTEIVPTTFTVTVPLEVPPTTGVEDGEHRGLG